MSQETNMKILRVKLVKGGEKLELSLQESGTVQSIDQKECKNPVHPDLTKAVQCLSVHLAILCDFIEPKQSGEVEELEKFTVTGYSIGGKEGEEGVIITGMRKTKSGQKYSINSPFTRFEAEEQSRYILMHDLQTKIFQIEDEVNAYLFEGKMQQPSLFGDKDAEGKEGIVTNLQFAEAKSDEDREQEMLNTLRQGGNGSMLYANPDAMAEVAEMGNGPVGAKSDVTDWTKDERDKLRGKGRKRKES